MDMVHLLLQEGKDTAETVRVDGLAFMVIDVALFVETAGDRN
jgi:hypothetical protein